MAKAIYPGTFDPMTLGHVDVATRAAALFDEVVVAVGTNPAKQTLFSLDDRVDMAREATQRLSNVRVDSFEGLVIDYARKEAPAIILRGLRNGADFESEVQMAVANRAAGDGVETLFLPTSPDYAYHTASLVKQLAAGGADVGAFVSETVARRLQERFAAGGTQ